MPSARSSDSAPVGIALTRTCAPSSPMRMTVPLPNWRSICVSAPCSAASRALAAFSSFGGHAVADLSWLALREQCSVAAGSDGTRPYARSCHGSTRVRHESARGDCAARPGGDAGPADVVQLERARQRLVARRPAAAAGSERKSDQPRRAARSVAAAAASGSVAARSRRPRRTRATVTCGRNGPRLGLATAAQRRRRVDDVRAAARRARRRRPPSADREHVRPARGQPQRPASASAGAGEPATAAHDRPRGVDLVERAVAEEGEREVQRVLARPGAARGRSRGHHAPKARQPGADAAAAARAPRTAARVRRGTAPRRSSSRRTRCIATVVERSRTSARSPGRCTLRVSRAPSGAATLKQTSPPACPRSRRPGRRCR